MDTVQMNKKSKKLWIAVISICFRKMLQRLLELLRKKLREQAKDEPEKLGFNVIVVGTSIRIPRIPFLNYILGSNPLKGV